MAKVHFVKEKITIDVKHGEKLSECIRQAGLVIETPCNCLGVCGKCKVKAWGDLSPKVVREKELFNEDDVRLACLAKVYGEAWVELSEISCELNTVNSGFSIECDENNAMREIALPATEELLGVAVDIGTTGISAYLLNLANSEIINKVSSLNRQTQFGGDVLSRISFCLQEPMGTHVLRDTIIKQLNEMIIELCGSVARTKNIYHIMVAANTTMLHFLLCVFPGSIAKAPYRPVFTAQVDMPAQDAGIEINPSGRLTLLPSASAYVGADILAGVAATGFDKKDYPAIFLDIGTNGEIVANIGGRLFATSTAAGPALEGMNISCGCRAEKGAIDAFFIDEQFNLKFTTIKNAEPKGICGSGLIDIAAALVKNNIVLPSGRFNNQIHNKLINRLVDKRFYITENIYLSQTDIRQVQLAKGAISAGITMLLEKANVPHDAIEEAVIAGAFGYHINQESIRQIGLLPKGFKGKVAFVGNSAIEGARLALLNKDFLAKINHLKDKIEVVELSTSPYFQNYFVKALSF